jgi:hypothetical protein
MDFAPLLAAVALIWKIVDLGKYTAARNTQAVVTQVLTWVAGVLVTLLLAATDFASGINIGDRALADLNLASVVLLGLSMASSASVLVDAKKAVDNTDSAVVPSRREKKHTHTHP